MKGGDSVTGNDLAVAGCKYLGVPYSRLDCQAFVEKSLADCGIKVNLPGSNAWLRETMRDGWTGTPEECRKQYGAIPPGAFLFILEHDGKEPAIYKPDGIGNASHIGIYTGMSGKQMVELSGMSDASKYNFGDGAIHSSASRGFVCTSRFNGKSVSGGWNLVGLWNPVFEGSKVTVVYKARVIGGTLNIRESPSISAKKIGSIPDGTIVEVSEEQDKWSKTTYNGKTGWVLNHYLEKVDEKPDFVYVPRNELHAMYDRIGDWLGLKG